MDMQAQKAVTYKQLGDVIGYHAFVASSGKCMHLAVIFPEFHCVFSMLSFFLESFTKKHHCENTVRFFIQIRSGAQV